jgi:hypothetical protein
MGWIMYFAVVITVLQSKSRDWPKSVNRAAVTAVTWETKSAGHEGVESENGIVKKNKGRPQRNCTSGD